MGSTFHGEKMNLLSLKLPPLLTLLLSPGQDEFSASSSLNQLLDAIWKNLDYFWRRIWSVALLAPESHFGAEIKWWANPSEKATRWNRSRMPMFEDSAFDCVHTTGQKRGRGQSILHSVKTHRSIVFIAPPKKWPWTHFGDFPFEKSHKNLVSSRQRNLARSKLASYL